MKLWSLFSSVQSIESFISIYSKLHKNDKVISMLIETFKNNIDYKSLNRYGELYIRDFKKNDDFYLITFHRNYNSHVSINLNYKLCKTGLRCSCSDNNICEHKIVAIAYLLKHGLEGTTDMANPLDLIDTTIIEEKVYKLAEIHNKVENKLISSFDKLALVKKNNPRRWKLVFVLYYHQTYEYEDRFILDDDRWKIMPCMQYIRIDGSTGKVSDIYDPEKITEEIGPAEHKFLSIISRSSQRSVSFKMYLEWLIDNQSNLDLFIRVPNGHKVACFKEIGSFSIDFFISKLGIKDGCITEFSFKLLLRCNLKGQNETVEIQEFHTAIFKFSDLYLLLENGEILFKKDLPYNLTSILNDHLFDNELDYAEVLEIKDYLEKNPAKDIKIDFVEDDLKIVTMVPRPILEIEQTRGGFCGLRLFFQYKDLELYFYNPELHTKTRNIYNTNKFEFIVRNADFENSVFEYLKSQTEKLKRSEYNHWNGESYTFVFDESINDFILDKGIDLIEEGYEIRVEKKKIISKFTGKLSYRIKSGIDWFDIETNLEDEEGTVSRVSFENYDFKNGLIFHNNNYYVLTKKDIQRLQALIQSGVQKDGNIRTSKFNFEVIDILYNDIKNKQAKEVKKIRAIMKGLKDFSRIKKIKLPEKFSGTLRNYQKSGYYWLNFLHDYDICGCLADDMGLGKTVQALCFLQYLKEKMGKLKVLLVVPVTTISNWEAEISRFTSEISFIRNFGNNRVKDIKIFREHDIVIISYHTLTRDIEWLKNTEYDYVVLDESQYIKNANTKIAKAVRLLPSKHRLSLTGTPVENNTLELWSQMNFLNPGLLGPLRDFTSRYTFPIEKHKDEEAAERLRKLIFPFVLRRKKDDVLNDLPDKEEIIQILEMGHKQKKFYDSQKAHYKSLINEKIDTAGVGNSTIQILDALLRLRQIALFPQLLKTGYTPKDSCKYNLITEILPEIMEENHKVLLFSQFVGVLNIIRSYFDKCKVQYSYIDGSTKRRDIEINRFQNDDNIKLFLLSLKAGGIGINLTSADYVILFDPWWNPAVETQAVDRAYRIGQAKKVTVYKLIVKDSIEEKILKLQESKKELVNKLITQEASFFKSLNKDDIMQLFN